MPSTRRFSLALAVFCSFAGGIALSADTPARLTEHVERAERLLGARNPGDPAAQLGGENPTTVTDRAAVSAKATAAVTPNNRGDQKRDRTGVATPSTVVASPGVVIGRVVSVASGGGIADIVVEAWDPLSGERAGVTTTQADGRYRIGGLPAGVYEVQVYGGGFLGEVWPGAICANGVCPFGTGREVRVSANRTRRDINFELEPGGSVLGFLVDPSGAPAAGQSVDVHSAATGVYEGSATTRGDGRFIVGGLPGGGHHLYLSEGLDVSAQYFAGVASVDEARAVRVVPGRVSAGINWQLVLGGTVSGVVRGADGQPIAGALVTLFAAGRSESTFTDAAGHYELEVLAVSWFVEVSAPGHVTGRLGGVTCPFGICSSNGAPLDVALGGAISDLDFELAPGSSVRGRMRDRGGETGIAGSVQLIGRNGAPSRTVATAADGTFTIEQIPIGAYGLRGRPGDGAYMPALLGEVDCPAGRCNGVRNGTELRLDGNDLAAIDLTVVRGASIRGELRSAASGELVEGLVAAQFPGYEGQFVVSTDDGHFELVGLPAGEAQLLAKPSDPYLLTSAWPQQPCPGEICAVVDTVKVELGEVREGFVISHGPAGAISGTLRDTASGEVIDDLLFVLLLSDSGVALNFAVVFGEFELSGVPAGRWKLAGGPFGLTSGYLTTLHPSTACAGFLCELTEAGSYVEVTEGETSTGVDIALQPAGRISGVLRDVSTGDPISGVRVRAVTRALQSVASGFSNSAGDFTLEGLPAGEFFLRSDDAQTLESGEFVPTVFGGGPCSPALCDLSEATQVTVAADHTSPPVELLLARGGKVSGRVIDAVDGRPLRGLVVRLVDAAGDDVRRVTTDELGQFEIGGVPPGEYWLVSVSYRGYVGGLLGAPGGCPGGACGLDQGTRLLITDSSTHLSHLELRLDREVGRPGGRVFDELGEAAVGAFVMLFDSAGRQVGQGADVSVDGSWRADGGLGEGSYRAVATGLSPRLISQQRGGQSCGLLLNTAACDLDLGLPIEVPGGEELTKLDFVLELGAALSGRVMSATSGAPLAGVRVLISNDAGASYQRVTTRLDGTWFSDGLPPGTYYVHTVDTFDHLEQSLGGLDCENGCDPTQGTAIELGDTPIGGLELVLPPG